MTYVLPPLYYLPMTDIINRSQSSFLLNSDTYLAYRMESQTHTQNHSSPGSGMVITCLSIPHPVPGQAWLTNHGTFLLNTDLTVLFSPAQLWDQLWEVGRTGNSVPISQMKTKADGGQISGPRSYINKQKTWHLNLDFLSPKVSDLFRIRGHLFIIHHSFNECLLCSRCSANPRAQGNTEMAAGKEGRGVGHKNSKGLTKNSSPRRMPLC